MFEQYRKNVQRLCDGLNIENPIQEEVIWIKAISFKIKGRWKKITSTNMNRAGFLFFQDVYRIPKGDVYGFRVTATLKFAAEAFFAENWRDAEEKGRPLLTAFKQATDFKIHLQ